MLEASSPNPKAGADPGLLACRLAMVAAGICWSLGGIFIKTIPVSAAGITFYRSLFAALCLLPLLRGRALPRPTDSAAAIVFYTLLLGLYVAATQGTTAANAIFLQYTAPLYAMVLGPLLFREPFRRADARALAIALAGIGILFFGNFRGGERGPLLMGAGSGLMFGLFLLWLRRMREADPIAVTAVNNAGVALLSGAALLWLAPADAGLIPRTLTGEVPARALGLLVLMGAVQIALPYTLFSYGLRRVPAVEGSLLALIEPVLNPVWVALWGEHPTPATLAGGALVVGALAARYTLFRERFQER